MLLQPGFFAVYGWDLSMAVREWSLKACLDSISQLEIALHSNANVALRKEQYDIASKLLLAVLIVEPFSGLLFQSSSSDTLGVGEE